MADDLICRCRKRFPSGFELDCDLRIPLAGPPVTVLFGPSGSGKTTLLRLLAGLDQPDSGEILFRGETWFDSARATSLAPQRRSAGFLFQDYALFPHLTVAENVRYAEPSRTQRAPRKGAVSGALLKTFGLSDLAARRPSSLSGGQQQRVALARALAANPALLLLDEPLSALDHPTRLRMRRELRRLLIAGGVPSILVTHDRMEAIGLGDWMAVMVDGRVRQAGPVEDVFRHPADARVAETLGVENVLRVRIASWDGGLLSLRLGSAHLECVAASATFDGAAGAPTAWACIRAEDVVLMRGSAQPSSARNRLSARVEALHTEGPIARVELDCGFPLVAAITAQSAAEMELKPGDSVLAVIKATAIHLIPE